MAMFETPRLRFRCLRKKVPLCFETDGVSQAPSPPKVNVGRRPEALVGRVKKGTTFASEDLYRHPSNIDFTGKGCANVLDSGIEDGTFCRKHRTLFPTASGPRSIALNTYYVYLKGGPGILLKLNVLHVENTCLTHA